MSLLYLLIREEIICKYTEYIMGNGALGDLKIPDLWFDFYARFLPGLAFIAYVRVLVNGCFSIPNLIEFISLLLLGFIYGLILQPISALLVDLIQKYTDKWHNKDHEINIVKKIQYDIDRDSRDSMIISKMHAEVTFFVQMALFVLISFFYRLYVKGLPKHWFFYIIILLFFFIESFLVANRRLKRALEAKNIVKNTK